MGSHPSARLPYGQWQAPWWVAIVTPANLLVVALFMVVLPLVLLTAESFLASFLDVFQVLDLNEETVVRSTLPWQYYLKLVVFVAFSGGLLMALQTQIKLNTLTRWAKRFDRPDPLHVDFNPEPADSIRASVQWIVYRWMVIVLPPVLLVVLAVGFGWLGLSIMNTVVDLATIALPSAITVFMFVGLMLGVITALTCGNAVWLMLTTAFGEVAAIAEPDLPPRIVFDRVRRIAFCSPLVWVLYPSVLVFWVLALWSVISLLMTYDVIHILNWQLPWIQIFVVEGILIGAYLILNYLTLFAYHHALTRYYQQLPPAFRERFTRPDPL